MVDDWDLTPWPLDCSTVFFMCGVMMDGVWWWEL